jgi:hypothetical protein
MKCSIIGQQALIIILTNETALSVESIQRLTKAGKDYNTDKTTHYLAAL